VLDELLDYLFAPDIEENVFVRLRSACWRGRDLSLELAVDATYGAQSPILWRVDCSEVVEYALADGQGDVSVHESERVLTRQHSDPTCSLMFRSRPSSIPECVGKLWLAHQQAAGDWIPFDRYRNGGGRLDAFLRVGHGILASGPSFLIRAYADAMAGMGAGEYVTDDVHSESRRNTRLAAFIVGRAFVVARGFEGVPITPT
jgi:hypothetical protein